LVGSTNPPPHRVLPPSLVLALAVIGISFAGPLVRLSASHPLTIAIWRVGFSLTIIAAFLLATGGWRQWKRLDRRGLALAIGAGAMLAIHFWTWNASIAMTTVAASVVLVNLQPAIVAVLSAAWLGEPPAPRQWSGIAIAMLGALVIAVPDFRSTAGDPGRHPLEGDLLAVVGAITAATYFVTGRRLRATLDLWPYVSLVYGACLVVLVGLALVVHAPVLAQPPRELAIFAALAIGPMLLGHTGLNWALKYLPAYVVNVALLGEPVGATILAAALPVIHEAPTGMTVAGGALVLAGIYVTARKAPSIAEPSRD
jgi:drug/metabolite transporter (DMT)-like permease